MKEGREVGKPVVIPTAVYTGYILRRGGELTILNRPDRGGGFLDRDHLCHPVMAHRKTTSDGSSV